MTDSEPEAMALILEGELPEKPIFSTTRGYTEELWELTTSCWNEDPRDRPTVDDVLDVLRNSAEQWESMYGEDEDDRSSTFTEESDPTTQTIPEKTVDRIQVGTASPLGKDKVREAVEILEMVSRRPPLIVCPTNGFQVLESYDQKSSRTRALWTSCLQGLVEICGEHAILPDSYAIPESKVRKLNDSPISSSSFSDVWRGVYEEDKSIAIKVIRCRNADDALEIKKVGYSRLCSPPRSH